MVGRNAGIQGDESSYVVVLHVKTVWMNDVEVSINDDFFHKLGTVLISKGVSSVKSRLMVLYFTQIYGT